jgi:hypothetical protein
MSYSSVHFSGTKGASHFSVWHKSGRDYLVAYPGGYKKLVYFSQFIIRSEPGERFEFDIDPFFLETKYAGDYGGARQNDCRHYHAEGGFDVLPSALPDWYWDSDIDPMASAVYYSAKLDPPIKAAGYYITHWWALDNPKVPTTQPTSTGDITCTAELWPDGYWFKVTYDDKRGVEQVSWHGPFVRVGVFEPPGSVDDLDSFKAECKRQLALSPTLPEYLWRKANDDPKTNFGALALRAAESVRFTNINGLAYVKDATELAKFASVITDSEKLFGNLADVAKTLSRSDLDRAAKRVLAKTHAGKAIKAASSAYLALHYGAKLGYADTVELASSLDDLSDGIGYEYQMIGAQQAGDVEYGSKTVHFKTKLTAQVDRWSRPQGFLLERLAGAKRAAYELDVAPTLANIWDLLPWSFVVDWFLPIGPIAEQMELEHYAQTFNVRKCFTTLTAQWETDQLPLYGFEGVRLSGSCTFSFYERRCSNVLPSAPPPDLDFPLKDLPRHFVEGAALTISRLMR